MFAWCMYSSDRDKTTNPKISTRRADTGRDDTTPWWPSIHWDCKFQNATGLIFYSTFSQFTWALNPFDTTRSTCYLCRLSGDPGCEVREKVIKFTELFTACVSMSPALAMPWYAFRKCAWHVKFLNQNQSKQRIIQTTVIVSGKEHGIGHNTNNLLMCSKEIQKF